MASAVSHRARSARCARAAITRCCSAATQPPGGRVVLVNGVEAWLEADGQRYPLTMQRYVPDLVYPDERRACSASTPRRGRPGASSSTSDAVLTAEVFVSKATRRNGAALAV